MAQAFVGLGSNLGDRTGNLRHAVHALDKTPRCTVQRVSRFLASAPLGGLDHPWYVNAVAMVATSLAPHALLSELLAIEQALGRRRSVRWAPRTLDLDLLLFDDLVLQSERLTVPHPGMAQRTFVLQPLMELAPQLTIPGLGPVQRLWQQLDTPALAHVDC